MNWVIVEIDIHSHVDVIQVVGPFETDQEAEAERRRRHLDRVLELGDWSANDIKSVVREVVRP